MLRVAACLEEHFPHSMAKAVVRKAQEEHLVHEEMHSKVDYLVAHGIASYDRRQCRVVIGSYHFVFEDEKACTILPEGKQALFVMICRRSSRTSIWRLTVDWLGCHHRSRTRLRRGGGYEAVQALRDAWSSESS